ncbi:hypothetical protein SBRCBS47491_008502 [Sporothrix bragantina]|uniref:Interferon-induced GTP-binding protein Mx n=1 Tax=Sporothrix bragantina TaxID=671064 RepID=A0ABP0CM39_9PEZI
MATDHSLGNNAFLAKIDRLRETNVGAQIPLPQVIVVGDQSSGKSSTLESLTGFAFPRAVNLCTRYVTQISCIRAPTKEICVSIIPRPNATPEIKARLQDFHHRLNNMDAASLAAIFQQANKAMGIEKIEGGPENTPAFSEDTLKIDISGPDERHLTLVDIPGIFRVSSPGVTTDGDIQLVLNMVKRYMENPRSIILAVIPANVDIASQEILRLAAEADPEGLRTMGVLTKVDLVSEQALKETILELVNGHRNPLKLGYCIIKNRGADDDTSSANALAAADRAFFQTPPWSTCSASALGADALQARVRSLLLDISKREFPNVRAHIESRRAAIMDQLAALGPSRADEGAQRRHLVKIAAQAQDLIMRATNGHYMGNNGIFQRVDALRLVTKLVGQNEIFSKTLAEYGHIQNFRASDDDDSDEEDVQVWLFEEPKNTLRGVSAKAQKNDQLKGADNKAAREYSDIQDIVTPDTTFPTPKRGPLTNLIREVFQASRGPELGTFNGTVLATIFRTITTRWEPLMLSHISKSIKYVHDFTHRLLEEICPDKKVRDELWGVLLRDELRQRYQSAMSHGKFLLDIERNGPPVTLNQIFNTTVQSKREETLSQRYQEGGSKPEAIIALGMKQLNLGDTENSEMICDDLLNTIESYYKVARERFVDTLCQQVIYHMLLTGPDSPLQILSPDRIMQLSADQLEAIAGEDMVTVDQRQTLQRQLDSVENAMTVMRS